MTPEQYIDTALRDLADVYGGAVVLAHAHRLFDVPVPIAPPKNLSARWTDPDGSHMTVRSLGRDDQLRRRMVVEALRLESIDGSSMWNDTQLTQALEVTHRRRYQRNVIARARGIMLAEGWFRLVGSFPDSTGRPTLHFITTAEARRLMMAEPEQ